MFVHFYVTSKLCKVRRKYHPQKLMHENDVKGPFMQGFIEELGLSL